MQLRKLGGDSQVNQRSVESVYFLVKRRLDRELPFLEVD